MLLPGRRALKALEQAVRTKHDTGIARIPIVAQLFDGLNAPVIDLDSRDIVKIEYGVLVAVHGEAHFPRRGRVIGQCLRDPVVE